MNRPFQIYYPSLALGKLIEIYVGITYHKTVFSCYSSHVSISTQLEFIPLSKWFTQSVLYLHMYIIALKYLCMLICPFLFCYSLLSVVWQIVSFLTLLLGKSISVVYLFMGKLIHILLYITGLSFLMLYSELSTRAIYASLCG